MLAPAGARRAGARTTRSFKERRIMKTRILAIAALGLAFALTGCKSNPDPAALQAENESLRQQLDKSNAALETAERERQAAEARANDASSKPATAANGDFAGIDGVTASRIGNEVHVSIEGDVLFDSGKATLKDSAKKSLDKIVGVMKQKYAGKYIRVAGFTDTDPIKRSTFKSNYHLGFDRAYSVREFLVGKGLDGKTISLSSFGPDVPLKTKEQSRRVEVIVVD
jgi:flagellar motor protein MotB